MTFAALLTKELRLRLRRERSITVIIVYIFVLASLGLLFVTRTNGYNSNSIASLGSGLYALLAFVQLFLIIFITPAFTATCINGEKERQTFDLLLCSRLSAFSLISGKLVAGLANALLLIAASVPLFSLVFFFGGVGPSQVLIATLIFGVTAILVGTFGLFCSTLLKRPPVSTAVAYMFCVLWVLTPWILSVLLQMNAPFNGNGQSALLFIGNPILALMSTITFGGGGPPVSVFALFGMNIAPWIMYIVMNLMLTIVLILLSMWLVKPHPARRLRLWLKKWGP